MAIVRYFLQYFRKGHNGPSFGVAASATACTAHGTGRLDPATKTLQSVPQFLQPQGHSQRNSIQSKNVRFCIFTFFFIIF